MYLMYHEKKKAAENAASSEDKDGLDGIRYTEDDNEESHSREQEQSQLR